MTVLNLAFGLFAWASFGSCDQHHTDDGKSPSCVKQNVIDNLTVGGLSTAVKLLLCIDLLFTSIMVSTVKGKEKRNRGPLPHLDTHSEPLPLS